MLAGQPTGTRDRLRSEAAPCPRQRAVPVDAARREALLPRRTRRAGRKDTAPAESSSGRVESHRLPLHLGCWASVYTARSLPGPGKPPPPDLSLTWSSGQPSRREPIRQTRRPEPPVEPSRAYMPGPKRCPNPPSNRMLKMASSRPIVYPLLPAILTLSSSKNAKSAASTRLRRAPSPAATASRYRNQVVRGLGLVQRPGRAISFGL